MSETKFLLVTGHDFRTKRKASMHFFARELSKTGSVRFFSVGFSWLSVLKRDARCDLSGRANVPEIYQNVEAFLHKTLIHPFRVPILDRSILSKAWMGLHARFAPEVMRRWIKDADVILLEAGLSLIYFNLIKSINPAARIVYIASDLLETIGCSVQLRTILRKTGAQFDLIRIPSSKVTEDFGAGALPVVIPHGFDRPDDGMNFVNPFTLPLNAVTVGSMLFDAALFRSLCPLAPDVHFHVIGAGRSAESLTAPNLTIYDEMPFEQTRGYIQHANVGIAPYRADRVSPYLADTSLKLMQFAAAGLPAICPASVVGDHPHRFGYAPNDPGSVLAALRSALDHGRVEPVLTQSWSEVTEILLRELAARSNEVG